MTAAAVTRWIAQAIPRTDDRSSTRQILFSRRSCAQYRIATNTQRECRRCSGNDTLIANDTGNTLTAGGGNDHADRRHGPRTPLQAGASGQLRLLTGGSSASTGQHDLITDFALTEDKIDLTDTTRIAASSAVDIIQFLGAAAFDGNAGALDYFFDSARGVTVLQVTSNGDKGADFRHRSDRSNLAIGNFKPARAAVTRCIETNGELYFTQNRQ
jgi:hypothetical protein